MKRKIDTDQGLSLIRRVARGEELEGAEMKMAVRFALEEFATRHPGKSVEVRIPWVGAVQAIDGPRHTRGTPPNVVEMPADVWLDLVVGADADLSQISFSGTRADISGYLPLFGDAVLRPSARSEHE